MKKLAALVLFTVLFAVGCKTQSNTVKKDTKVNNEAEPNTMAFEYEAQTRGVYCKVIVTQDSVITIKDREMKNLNSTPTKINDWNFLVSKVKEIHPEELGNLKSPSNKNHVDAALAANFKVISNGVTLSSPNFDHGNPPAEIKQVVEKMLALSDLKKK